MLENGINGLFKEALRNIINNIQLYLSPRVRKSAKKAAALLTANSVGKINFKKIYNIDTINMLDIGAKNIKDDYKRIGKGREGLKILWVGSFQYRKSLQILIKALGYIPKSYEYELEIIGDGLLRKRWQELARKMGVSKNIHWRGWVPHQEVDNYYDWADVLVFTSLRDTCGSNITEALSRGLPIICMDKDGVSDVIDETCGVKIPVTNPGEVIKQLADSITWIHDNREILQKMSIGALARAHEYSWEKHAKRLARIYERAIEEKSAGIIMNC